MNADKEIRNHCYVNTYAKGDSFVGVKVNANDVSIHFPIGYQLSSSADSLRKDIRILLTVLSDLSKEDTSLEYSDTSGQENTIFPAHAYLKIISNFLKTGHYYIETESRYKKNSSGKVSWSRTIRDHQGFVQSNGALIFTSTTVRSTTPNTNNKITQIHRFCVYEAFSKMGWVYTSFVPEKPQIRPDIKEAIYTLEKKLATTHIDSEQELLVAMVSMLKYMTSSSSKILSFFGTYSFERTWEKMVDVAFGIKSKSVYFPKTHWRLMNNNTVTKAPLQPDSIMRWNNKIYILDSKYYRFGITGNPEHLPNGPDINKQITYGEYVENILDISPSSLFNAFIMPFNSENSLFYKPNSENHYRIKPILNIGEALSTWKKNTKNYEHIQGILIDTKFLMYNYKNMPPKVIANLVNAIEINKI